MVTKGSSVVSEIIQVTPSHYYFSSRMFKLCYYVVVLHSCARKLLEAKHL